MIQYSFSIADLEYFLLILTRVSCFIFAAPFFSMQNTPRRVRVAISVFTSILLYQTLTPAAAVEYHTLLGYTTIVLKEAATGLLIGFSTSICTSIVSLAGAIADMEVGLSMVQAVDPTTKQQTTITGGYYQYVVMLMLVASGMYRYLLGALADTFTLIPVNGAVFRSDKLLEAMLEFLADYFIIGFRIILPIFCALLMLNAILGILAKVSPQMNMFAIGMQIKIVVGLSVLFFTTSMLAGVADFVFQKMKDTMVSFLGGMM